MDGASTRATAGNTMIHEVSTPRSLCSDSESPASGDGSIDGTSVDSSPRHASSRASSRPSSGYGNPSPPDGNARNTVLEHRAANRQHASVLTSPPPMPRNPSSSATQACKPRDTYSTSQIPSPPASVMHLQIEERVSCLSFQSTFQSEQKAHAKPTDPIEGPHVRPATAGAPIGCMHDTVGGMGQSEVAGLDSAVTLADVWLNDKGFGSVVTNTSRSRRGTEREAMVPVPSVKNRESVVTKPGSPEHHPSESPMTRLSRVSRGSGRSHFTPIRAPTPLAEGRCQSAQSVSRHTIQT